MANNKRKKKQKVLYHRLVLLIVVFLLIVYLIIVGGIKIYHQFFPSEVEPVEKTVENKEVAKVEVPEGKYLVVIDAGHGGYDAGSVSQNGTYEKEMTLKVALKLGKYIESQRDDIEVLYTRENDDYYWTNDNRSDLFYRVNTATENDANLFISIHMNSNEESNEVRGHETWVSLTSVANETFAYNVDAALNELNYNACRGVKDESVSNLLVLHYNTVPSVLVELGYINNVEDYAYINSNEGSSAIARTLGEAMIKTLNEIND